MFDRAQCMLIMTSIIRVGQSHFASVPIDEDAQERILACLQSLAELDSRAPSSTVLEDIFLRDTQKAYATMVQHEEKKALEKKRREEKATAIQADDLISFRQLSKKNVGAETDEVRFRRSFLLALLSLFDEKVLIKTRYARTVRTRPHQSDRSRRSDQRRLRFQAPTRRPIDRFLRPSLRRSLRPRSRVRHPPRRFARQPDERDAPELDLRVCDAWGFEVA
jgi:hypothetical protein